MTCKMARRARIVRHMEPRSAIAIDLGEAVQAAEPAARAAAAEELLAGLNPAQRRAVTHGDGPLLVVAGAGTGKTQVITRRIAWLIATRRARPSEILALTFTDRAAEEMQARVDELVPYGYADTAIATFHAFGDRLIREFALELGLPSDPRVLSRAEAVIFLRERLFELGLERYRPLGDPTRFLGALVALFSRAKDEDVSPGMYAAHAARLAARAETAAERADVVGQAPEVDRGMAGSEGRRARAGRERERALELAEEAAQAAEIARAYDRYQELLGEAGCVDFGDQLSMALRLVRDHPAVRARLQRRYRYILVDEFQDTNPAQLELLASLAGEDRNVTVVGDDDQAIYAFRGAAVGNILQFRERFGGAREIVLRRNYRSRAPILAAAYRLIRHNDPDRLEVLHGIDKRLIPQRRSRRPLPVRHHAFATAGAEADWVADSIRERIEAGARPREVAVLVRANADADPVLRALNLAGVPWRFSGASGLYARPEVRSLLAALRTVADLDSSVDLYAVATAAPYGIGGPDLTRLLEAARRRNRSLWSVLEGIEQDPGLVPVSAETLARARRLVGDMRAATELAHRRPAGEVLYDFLRRNGTLAELAAGCGTAHEERVLNVARFFEIVRRQSAILPDDRVPFVVRHLGTLVEAGDDPASASPDDDADAVSVLTVHRAKGLEFPVVYLVGLVDGKFPGRGRRDPLALPAALRRDGRGRTIGADPSENDVTADGGDDPDDADAGVAEERRLFYVAMTRARDELVLTHAADYGGRRTRRVSPFVAEALDLPPCRPIPDIAAEVRASADARATSDARESGAGTASRAAPGGGLAVSLEQIAAFERLDASPTVAARVAAAPPRLSFSQLDDYLGCPRRYRYRHVLRIPTPPHHARSYGIALHAAVAAFGRSEMSGQPLAERDLLGVLEANWSSEGFLSREHEDARLAAARTALCRFRDGEIAAGIRPLAVERDFTFVLDGVRLSGRIDRIDPGPDGPTLTDYKSADVRDPVRARQRARESLQLAIYALAHRAAEGELPASLRLVFLDSGLEGSVTPEGPRLDRAREKVAMAADGIRRDAYGATPDFVTCGYCPFRDICPDSAA